jgi:hypothetical protein
MLMKFLANGGHRWQTGKAFTKALNAPPFMVNSYQQVWLSQGMNLAAQRLYLAGSFKITAEQNHTADQRMLQNLFLFLTQRGAEQIDHHRP